ncbi:uncharacterized protein YxeA [Chryseobacterium sp. H1D6B]|uniref:hypothetical protein n=1 Tax=Chryseobacterium sp. H1D6B TaxID=2940588 RepID=UPI0015C6E9C1|nr:hypothetical protein [Chryseobacterium sp. H1D6B]MDH6252652.1 uncharacterized protein YxeA [Chryseobacterium sp. H1D6B]
MKKIISLKIISILIIGILSLTLQSCRQDEDNDFQESAIINYNKSAEHDRETSRDTIKQKDTSFEQDPPIKNGTHWKYKG